MAPKTVCLLAFAAASILASCQKKPPVPAASVVYTRAFSTVGVTPPLTDQIANQKAHGTARLTAAVLEVAIKVADKERIVLSVDRNRLLPELAGKYELHDPAYADTNPGEVEYLNFIWTTTGRQARVFTNRAPSTTPTSGFLLVSRYDAEQNLISGSYYAGFSFVSDPRVLTPAIMPLWQIKLEGQFSNLPLAQ
jgi:hypothetical protein